MDERITRRRVLATLGAAATTGLAGCAGTGLDQSVLGTDREGDIVVAPAGSDYNAGTAAAPLASIEGALERADPGATVSVRPGEYRESVWTQRDGDPEAPITITGPPDAVVRPPPGSHEAIHIGHHHIHVEGLTITGLTRPEQELEHSRAYSDNCAYISAEERAFQGVDYLRGVVFHPARIGHAGKAIVQTTRLRDTVIGNFEVIGPAGVYYDSRIADTEYGHVGEIVYIGESEPSRGEFRYGYPGLDYTRNVRVHHVDNSAGYRNAEVVDIKLGCENVTVEYCTSRNSGYSSEDVAWPAINLGGRDCTIRWNDFAEGPLGISVSAWVPTGDIDGTEWARDNAIYGNRVADFDRPFRFLTTDVLTSPGPDAQRVFCGNDISGASEVEVPAGSAPCPDDVPKTDTIGHRGGDSPWTE